MLIHAESIHVQAVWCRGGWYKIEFRIAIDMASFGYHIYMLYHVRDAKRVVVEAAKSW